MKHYLDIENLRETEIDLGDGLIRAKNCQGFEVGDIISIQEKYDGANSSICWDEENETKLMFSHRKELDPTNTLQGFYAYALSLSDTPFRDNPDYVVFGEWGLKNAIVYRMDAVKKWYVFDIFNKRTECWLSPEEVEQFCDYYGLIFIHSFYTGPFISWEHCKSFSHLPQYGDIQEGIIVKNHTKMNDPDNRAPFMLKIVNDEFKETKRDNHRKKVDDPQKLEEKAKALALMESIVTKRRVEKMLNNLRDEGILPNDLEPKHMSVIAKLLPKRIYEDCLKEEKEIVYAAGEYAGKACNTLSMNFAKEIVLGINAGN